MLFLNKNKIIIQCYHCVSANDSSQKQTKYIQPTYIYKYNKMKYRIKQNKNKQNNNTILCKRFISV